MRIVLILVVIAAVATLLWGTWQMGRKVFLPTLVAVLIGLMLLILAGVFSDDHQRRPASPDSVTVTVDAVNGTETGYRLSGRIRNRGSRAVAEVWLDAEALSCSGPPPCKVIYQQRKPVPMHVPAGGAYPLAVFIDKPAAPIHPDRWRLRVTRVEVYGG